MKGTLFVVYCKYNHYNNISVFTSLILITCTHLEYSSSKLQCHFLVAFCLSIVEKNNYCHFFLSVNDE